MLDQQAVLYRALQNAILLGGNLLDGHHDITAYVDQIVSIAPLLDDRQFQDVVDSYRDNEIVAQYNSLVEATEPQIKRYWSNVYFKMLVAGFAGGMDGLWFETNTSWTVKLWYNNGVCSISYYNPATREYMSGDIFELELTYVFAEIKERMRWSTYGHHPSVYPVKTKANTFRRLKEVKQ